MKTELFVFKVRKLLLSKERVSSENCDFLSFRDLPLESVLNLSKQSEDEFLESLSEILKHVAGRIYANRLHDNLSETAYKILGKNSIWPLSVSDGAYRWFEFYFKSALKWAPRLVVDNKFASEFERVLTRLVNILKRRRFISNVDACCFLRKSKKMQVERIRAVLQADLDDLMRRFNGVGLYGLLVYAYTLYVSKNYEVSKFNWKELLKL